jgi:DNA-binding CsgD family transcriptional regulator
MWYNNYGWNENPFTIKSGTNLVGVEDKKEELLNYIMSGDICLLNGPTGVGKSSMLRWVEENLKDHTIVYIDAAGVDNNFSISTFLRKQNSFWSKLSGNKFPKNVVILLDESQDCDEELVKALKLHWDHQHVKSIVITQINPNLDGFSESFKHRVGNRIVKLGKISISNGYDLIKNRTQGKNPFDKSAIEAIVEKSNFIPRKILEACEIVCTKYSGKKLGINVFDVEESLNGQVLHTNHVPIPRKVTKSSSSLSPMQSSIIQTIAQSEKTTQELASELNTTEGSVGKQLSKLIKMDKIKITNQTRPKKYGLAK